MVFRWGYVFVDDVKIVKDESNESKGVKWN